MNSNQDKTNQPLTSGYETFDVDEPHKKNPFTGYSVIFPSFPQN